MKRIMMIAAAAAMAGLLFVACKNTPKAAEEAAPKEPDLTALNAGDDLDWEEFSRYYSAAEEETPACCEEKECEEFEEEVAEDVEECAEEIAERAEEAIMEPGTIEPEGEEEPAAEEEIAAEEAEAAPVEYFAVAQKPGFQGGDPNAFCKWVAQNMVYPDEAREANIEGTVVVKFTIGRSGAVRGAHVLKSSGNAALDAEAVRTISAAPAWTPGFDNQGVPVNTNMVMPVIFKLAH